ncbi:MAG: helix-turn-helix transcriptional regulator, partial [Synergistaceae bacterium]|nr:helix-turn-helix transcriptional regulator [Synergistaceae bacterium]
MSRWKNADRTPLAVLRANAGLSRNQASVLLDVALNTLGRYETGEGEVPLDIAEDMSILYKVP